MTAFDVIDTLAGLDAGGDLAVLRDRRPQARVHAQRSFEALFEPDAAGSFPYRERYAVAFFVATLHRFAPARDFYEDVLADEAPDLVGPVAAAAASGLEVGPYGRYREADLDAESDVRTRYRLPADLLGEIGEHLAAALEHAHLLVFRPREASPDALRRLVGAGWDADAIVTLSQLVAFLAFQLRSAWSLRVIAGDAAEPPTPGAPSTASAPREWPEAASTDLVTDGGVALAPTGFTQEGLGWVPWLQPVAEADLSDEQRRALIEPGRAAMPYFRLLARDAAALHARTLTDLDIFTNPDGGLPRADRELAAAAASRLNGCVFCASVHAGFATRESRRRDDVQRLLDDGVGAALGSDVWDAVAAAAAALSATPPRFDDAHIAALTDAGLDRSAVIDVANSAAFFNWANRLMLSLGEPEVPARRRPPG